MLSSKQLYQCFKLIGAHHMGVLYIHTVDETQYTLYRPTSEDMYTIEELDPTTGNVCIRFFPAQDVKRIISLLEEKVFRLEFHLE